MSYVYSYVPVYQRLSERWVVNHRMVSASKYEMVPKHEKGNVDFWGARPTSKPVVMGRIVRMRKQRVGQLELFNKVKRRRKKIEQKDYLKVY